MPFPPIPVFTPVADPRAVVAGKNFRFTVLSDRLIRLEFSRSGQFEDRPSQAFWRRQQPVPEFSQATSNGWIGVETSALNLRYRPTWLGFNHFTLSITLKASGVTWHYGDSARRAGNLKGTARTLDMMPTLPARMGPGLLSKAGWALVDDSKSLVFNPSGWIERRGHRETDLYFFGYGDDAAGCLADFTGLAGPIPLIPRFILGNWWSRYWPYTQTELQSLMEEFRVHDFPLSVCIVDMDWHLTKSKVPLGGWTGYTWNRELFPDPPAFIRWLHDHGLRTALNLHPASGVRAHEEAYPAMARWMGVDPQTRQIIRFDLTDPKFAEGYFKFLHHPQEEIGVDFWWMDWQQGTRSCLPGLDPLWWINHLHYYDLGRDGVKRPFVFSRWGGLGHHRYPIGFSGDTVIGWKALAFQPYFTATAANVAYGWWSHDIGGHMGKDLSHELYLRWIQFGVFSPIFRIHSSHSASLDRRPWSKPERITNAARQAMTLRYALIPYIYSMAWRAHRTGLSLVTPMYYNAIGQADAFQASDQYFFGSELVVAPFVTPSDETTGLSLRQVWLPQGVWFNFFNGEALKGGGWHRHSGPLEDIPVFAKAGAIVPLAPQDSRAETGNPSTLDVYLFPGAANRFDLYEDDGETTAYQAGVYALTRLSLEKSDQGLMFNLHAVQGDAGLLPTQRTWRVHLRGVTAEAYAMRGDGPADRLPSRYNPAVRTLTLDPFILAAGEGLAIFFQGVVSE